MMADAIQGREHLTVREEPWRNTGVKQDSTSGRFAFRARVHIAWMLSAVLVAVTFYRCVYLGNMGHFPFWGWLTIASGMVTFALAARDVCKDVVPHR